MTRHLDLRTGTPVWSAYRARRVPVARLRRDVKADVLVIGMGISGALAAETLTASGLSVAMIDRRGPLKGSTAATTALVQYEIDQPLTLLAEKIGKGDAERAWRRSRLATMNLKARIDECGIDCRMAPRPSLYLAGNVLDAGGLREEAEARRRAGIHATYLTRGDLRDRFGIDRTGAILSHDNLAIDPRKLTAGLLIKAQSRGARLYAPADAVGFEEHADSIATLTGDGPVIRAQTVVMATGYELTEIVPPARHRIVSTWAIATRPQPRGLWPEQAMIWESSDPYLYLRATADGRVICGGEDEDFADEERRDALIGAKSARIAAKLRKLLPALDTTPQFAWAGSFGTTSTGLPAIGMVPRHPRMFAVMGYGGNGITYSQIASEILRAAISGGRDSDAGLFAF
ncbi:MAG: NAD(P)/FAD-dependent oxidoreductase [Rhizobiaceae bacterium]